ncbi:MAG: 50S ribosomal protein L16 [Candidatus Dojkabacteria bacterium]|uniref:Large ribosomal subunit protein uL16 n=2 Tax=Candidatus Dojkabacteria TaxID=74243 RepID=A0A136KKW9_9BACT|nr:MAG: 50S ribosomal protein L16 [candidate division WS6 bacterium OLB21]MBW7953590.1 50S ribosomal protein L16 [Candidatus Dojkabacteria bacterium]WKZ27865.1 MAG: 50S ribosomal protein L16 [Candidatus Dojkabacteria bacterium]
MLQPRKTKHRKEFRGQMKGQAMKGNKVTVGDFGLQATTRSWINGRQIEAARKVIVREMKRKGKLWIRIFPHKPYTKKPAEVRMGKGKGDVEGYVAVVKPGRVMFEIGGVTEETAHEALRKAAQKLPVLTKIIEKN